MRELSADEREAMASEIKAIRTALGLSLTQFATALGLSGANAKGTIYRYEHARRVPSQITLAVIRRLAPVVKAGK